MGAQVRVEGHEPRRLTPTMSSRKLQALDFIKRYFAGWGHSPTLGELAAELDVSTKRAHDLVHQLSVDKMIEVTVGKTRGIRLVERGEELSQADILVLLARRGWTVGVADSVVRPPEGQPGASQELNEELLRTLTEKGLPDVAELDHVASLDEDEGSGTSGEEAEARPAHSSTAGDRRPA